MTCILGLELVDFENILIVQKKKTEYIPRKYQESKLQNASDGVVSGKVTQRTPQKKNRLRVPSDFTALINRAKVPSTIRFKTMLISHKQKGKISI